MLSRFAQVICRAAGSLAFLGLLVFGAGSASAQVQSTFNTLTAPHAALGAPIQYSLVVVNNGGTTVTLTQTVNLVAPDSTSYSLLNTTSSYTAGLSRTTTKTLTTSTLTSQLGTFQLTAKVTQGTTVLFTQTIPLTITAVPANGVYASVGGVGPASALFGTPTTYRVVITNFGTASLTYKKNLYAIMTDGTQQLISKGPSLTLAAGSNSIPETTTNVSVWTTAVPGSYGILVNIVDGSNNLLATDTYNFARNALATSAYYPTFTDTTMAAGINMMRMAMKIPQGCAVGNGDYMLGGIGMAVADFDGDGYDDIYIVDMMGMGVLYHNNHDGTFTDQTMAAGIPMVMNQSGAIWGDIDNDGRPDLLILTNPMMGMASPVLLHNNGPNASGQVTFTDISASSGIPAAIGSTQNLQSATFGDYDGDGLLDLYITVHVDCNTANANDHLFHNNGNLTFTDVSNLVGGTSESRRGLVTTFVDYNKSGRPSIYVGNDEGNPFGANQLWRNDGPGGTGGWIFTDASSATSSGISMSAMGLAVGDYDRDGNFEIFATNTGTNVLLKWQPSGTFKSFASDTIGAGAHVARALVPIGTSGLGSAVTWGAGFYDFNNDGWEDLFVSSGPINSGSGLYNEFFLNNQDGTFLDISNLTGTLGDGMSNMNAAVFADFNNDGFMDFITFGMMGNAHLFMNNARSNGNPYNWLQVKLVGGCNSATGCTGLTNHDAIGAYFVANVGSAQLWRQVIDGGAPGGNSTLVQQLGLGTATQVDSLTVYWPSGKTTTLNNIMSNQKIIITEM